jgi:beta-phosphoglucomutase-like phosphatase (HAD superfamily)
MPYRNAAERLRVSPASIVAVEDSLTGLVSARAAGLYSVLFTMQDGGLEEEDTDRRPDLTIDALAGVAALFSTGNATSHTR